MPTQLLHMDCMEYMKNCGDGFFDLAICDPPYGIDVAKTGKVGGKNAPLLKIMERKSGTKNLLQ